MSSVEYPRPNLGESPTAKKTNPLVTFGIPGLIVIVVFAVFMPVHPDDRPAGKRTVCLSNLKQMALGCIMYAGDYDERMPIADRWMDSIVPYTKDESMFHDPEREAKSDYDYAFSLKASGVDSAKAKRPENFILIFDSDLKKRNASSGISSMPKAGRHEGINNVAYLDGHAKRYPTPWANF